MTDSQSLSPASSRLLWRTALISLVVLMAVSAALVTAAPAAAAGGLLPPGLAFAVCKIVALALVFHRVWKNNVYSMQWSSMLILLFIAEGVVRATSDPQPSAGLGLLEAIVAAVYFAAVLTILRPIKKQAGGSRRRSSP